MNRLKRNEILVLTSVSVRLVKGGYDGLIGWASCTLNGCLRLNNIAIRVGGDGRRFLTYPAKRLSGGRTITLFNPTCTDLAAVFEREVLRQLEAHTGARSEIVGDGMEKDQ